MTQSFGETPEQVRWVLTHGIREFQRQRQPGFQIVVASYDPFSLVKAFSYRRLLR
jgi:hypothetical protein